MTRMTSVQTDVMQIAQVSSQLEANNTKKVGMGLKATVTLHRQSNKTSIFDLLRQTNINKV